MSATATQIEAKVRYTVHFIEKSPSQATTDLHAMQNTETQVLSLY